MATETKRKSVRTDDPELVAETKISRIMADLDDIDRAGVIAWYLRKYVKDADK